MAVYGPRICKELHYNYYMLLKRFLVFSVRRECGRRQPQTRGVRSDAGLTWSQKKNLDTRSVQQPTEKRAGEKVPAPEIYHKARPTAAGCHSRPDRCSGLSTYLLKLEMRHLDKLSLA